MAESEDDFSLLAKLNSDEISLTVSLADALVANEVEKFLELYDNIPRSFSAERIDCIKEMARQLAALPKKQFDMYRNKAWGLISGDYFPPPPTTQVSVEKINQTPIVNNGTMECNMIENTTDALEDITTEPMETEKQAGNSYQISPKSSKKKKKSKKQKSKSSVVNNAVEPSADKTGKSEEKEMNVNTDTVMKQKLLDPDGSRTAIMNERLVADISTGPSGVYTSRTYSGEKKDSKSPHQQHPDEGNRTLENNGIEHMNTLLNAMPLPDKPPFGFPLSADKLITSAVGLLSSDTLYSIDSKLPTPAAIILPSLGDTHQNRNLIAKENQSKEITGDSLAANESKKGRDLDKKLEKQTDKLQMENLNVFDVERDSGDGDVSSALEDEGWQSQTRRSHRKKKKELAVRSPRERNRVDQRQETNKHNTHFQNQNTAKRQNSKKGHFENGFRNSVENNKLNGTEKAKLAMVKNFEDLTITANDSCQHQQGGNSSSGNEKNVEDVSVESLSDPAATSTDSKAAFSYRDALLKVKPSKPKDELHYSSDSGVDANSVSSCDSGIPSPELPPQEVYNYKQSVSFLMKGWNEILDLKKKGQVTYYNNEESYNRKRQRKGPYKPRNNQQRGARNTATTTAKASNCRFKNGLTQTFSHGMEL